LTIPLVSERAGRNNSQEQRLCHTIPLQRYWIKDSQQEQSKALSTISSSGKVLSPENLCSWESVIHHLLRVIAILPWYWMKSRVKKLFG